MDHTGDRGREAGADLSAGSSTEVHSHLAAGGAAAGAEAAGTAGTEAGGTAARTINRVRAGAEEGAERLREAGHELHDRVQNMREKLDDGWSETRGRVRGAMGSAEEVLENRTGLLPWTRSNPMPAALLAFGAGLVLSGAAIGGRRTGVRGQLRSALMSSLGAALVTQVRGFLDETLRS